MPDDLTTDEGVDEGSAASAAEDDAGPDPAADVVGAAPHGGPPDAAEAAPPLTPHDETPGPGQQLAEGEG